MFTRLFLLIGMIGLFSVPMRAEEVTIGSGTTINPWLPSHSYYKYSLTQQIYTNEEIGEAGTITSIAFYNAGQEKTRTYDVYLVNTEKSSFSGSSDWISVTSNDLVFSGSVTMAANTWTQIPFTSTFEYEGNNLAVVVNDKTGGYSQGMECRVFTPSGDQGVVSLYASKDGSVNYDLSNPGNASGTVTFKNQIILDIETAAVTCAKPKNFTATSITAHTATLTWQPGAEGQSNWDVYVTTTANDVPDENTTPTYQVTECSKALANLIAQTTYYAYVRANCGGGDKSKWANTTFTTTREALSVDANNPYSQDFETNNDWGFTNGTQTNQWSWGSATNNGGSKAMYISNDNGTSYAYTLNSTTVVFASKLLNFAQGTYTFVFDWQAKGEGSSYSQYDYLRAILAPGDIEFTAGSLPSGVGFKTLPDSWIALDGGQQLNLQDGWQSQTTEATISGTYTMVFIWRNDSGGGSQPPAAIDNISISLMSCPRPTALTAGNITGRTVTLSWTENGSATNWVLQYATDASFTENLIEVNVGGTPSKNLSGLSPETTYYTRVKSVLGSDESLWSDVEDFTTTATCEKPTLSYVTNSNTAHTGTVSWTGNTENYELIYSTAYSFNPGDEGVIQIDLGSVNTYTLQNLTPETTYRIKVRANCGDDDGYSQWSNQVSFTTTATCIKPTGVTASNVTANTATITWTAGEAGQNAWNLQYKKSSESDWQSVPVTTNSYNLINLSPVTTYNVRVQADCGEGDLSQWTNNTNFTTGCAAIDLPYTCDFEGSSQTVNNCIIPSCWSVIRGYYNSTYRYGVPTMATPSTSTQPIVQQTHSGSYSLYFLNSTNYGTTEEYAILPEISEEYKMGNVQIRFWVRSYSSNCSMEVGVMTDPSIASTYVQVEVVDMTSTYTEKTISLSGYSGNGRYIALKCPEPTMYSQAFYVDDITVEYIPSCQVPDNLDAYEVGVNEATLTWTPRGAETAWNVQYKKASDSDWSEPIAVNETTYTLTGLKRSTEYEARVQANCNADDQSDWTNSISFTTECGIWPINAENALAENFNGETFPPDCWQKVNFGEMGITNGWLQSFNNPLDNNGAVSSDFKHETWLFLPQMHLDGEAFLSFDHLFGSGNDYIPSSIMISTIPNLDVQGILTEGFIETNFTQIWTANENNLPSTKRNETISLSSYDDQDVYIAFRYEGTYNYSGKIWYIDNVHVYVNVSQTIELSQGWNWWSTYLNIGLEDLEAALGRNGVNIVTNNGMASYSEEEGWEGNLSTLNQAKMYKIEVETNCSVILSGYVVNPADYTITLSPGVNWIGFPVNHGMSLNEAFAGFTPAQGDVVKLLGGGSAMYTSNLGWQGSLQNLEPGKGYIYNSKATTNKTFTFPTNAK